MSYVCSFSRFSQISEFVVYARENIRERTTILRDKVNH